MGIPLSDLVATFEELWPLSTAEEWDRPGLAVGNLRAEISKVMLCVDVTIEVIEEAMKQSAELIVSHHPPLLRGVSLLGEQTLKGAIVTTAIRNDVAIFSAHTNADIVPGGVSDELAIRIGIKNPAPLVATGEKTGHGRVGELAQTISLADFAEQVAQALPTSKAPIRVAGNLEKMIRKIAIVGGAGDSFLAAAFAQKVDCFMTSDLRHHVALDAVSDPAHEMALIDISHFAAERVWLEPLQKQLSALHPEIKFSISEIATDPWSLTLVAE